jgi:hypothetical protein
VPPVPPLSVLQAVIRQNLALAIGSIAALSLPTVLGWVPLWFAVMLHEGSTLLVALNSLRLLALGADPRRWRRAGDAAAAPMAAEAHSRDSSGWDAAGGSEERDALPAAAVVAAGAPPAV